MQIRYGIVCPFYKKNEGKWSRTGEESWEDI
jgi:hypothetical protein